MHYAVQATHWTTGLCSMQFEPLLPPIRTESKDIFYYALQATHWTTGLYLSDENRTQEMFFKQKNACQRGAEWTASKDKRCRKFVGGPRTTASDGPSSSGGQWPGRMTSPPEEYHSPANVRSESWSCTDPCTIGPGICKLWIIRNGGCTGESKSCCVLLLQKLTQTGGGEGHIDRSREWTLI